LDNGEIAKFWDDRWVEGEAPRDLAPDLFKLAFRKNFTVNGALINGNWMRGLQRLSTAIQLDQFLLLWGEIQNIDHSNTRDIVSWKLTTNGQYSAASANDVQFVGRIQRPGLAQAWKIRAEGKIKSYIIMRLT
jgi:hypothetical protein